MMILFSFLLPLYAIASNLKYFRLRTKKLTSHLSMSSKDSRYNPYSPLQYKNKLSNARSFSAAPIDKQWDGVMKIFGKFMKDYFLSISPKIITERQTVDLKTESKSIYKDIDKLMALIQGNFSKVPSETAIMSVQSASVFEIRKLLLDFLITLKVICDSTNKSFRATLVNELQINKPLRAMFFSIYKERFWVLRTQFKMSYETINYRLIIATKKFNDISVVNENYTETIKLSNSINETLSNNSVFNSIGEDFNTQETEASWADLSTHRSFDTHVVYNRVLNLKTTLTKTIEEFKSVLNEIQDNFEEQINNLIEVNLIDSFLNDFTYKAIKKAVQRNSKHFTQIHKSVNRASMLDLHEHEIQSGTETEQEIDQFLKVYKKKMKELITNFKLFYKKLIKIHYLIEIQESILREGFVIKQKLNEILVLMK